VDYAPDELFEWLDEERGHSGGVQALTVQHGTPEEADGYSDELLEYTEGYGEDEEEDDDDKQYSDEFDDRNAEIERIDTPLSERHLDVLQPSSVCLPRD
jgi:hypothetical protein